MRCIYGDHSDSIGLMIAGYFNKNTGFPVTGPFAALAWLKDNKMVAEAILNDYTGANIEIHLHSPKVFNKQIILDIYKQVFVINKCIRLTAKPFPDNERLSRLLPRLGFQYEFTQEKYYLHGDKYIDAKVYKLAKENVPKWVIKSAKAS